MQCSSEVTESGDGDAVVSDEHSHCKLLVQLLQCGLRVLERTAAATIIQADASKLRNPGTKPSFSQILILQGPRAVKLQKGLGSIGLFTTILSQRKASSFELVTSRLPPHRAAVPVSDSCGAGGRLLFCHLVRALNLDAAG